MTLGRPGGGAPLAVLLLTAAVLAACVPSPEPASAPAEPEPPNQEVVADEPPTEEPAAEERATEEPATSEPAGPAVTAYVVGYHWGWPVFDEDGTEFDVLRVPAGTTVELFAVNDHAREAIDQLPAPVAETIRLTDWQERVRHSVEVGRMPDPREEMGMSLDELLGAAHDDDDLQDPDASEDHGLMITGLGIQTVLEAHAREPERLVFTVAEDGTYTFVCTVYCGFGHEHQRWEMLEVGAG